MNKLVLALIFSVFTVNSAYSQETFDAKCSVRFSPKGGAQQEIAHQISNAKQTIYVLAYSFTDDIMADALVAAARRGVEVIVVVDGGQPEARGNKVSFIKENGIKTFVDEKHAISHNKVIIIDGYMTHTGSYNFSKNAEIRNAENSVWCNSVEMAKIYSENFSLHKSHAKEF